MRHGQTTSWWPWPSAQLPVPPVVMGTGRWLSVDGLLQWEREAVDLRRVEIPAEFWMRELLNLDVDDAEAVAEFITAYGMVAPYALDVTNAPRARMTESVHLDDLRVALRRLRNIARLVLDEGGAARRWQEEREDDGLGFDEQARLRWSIDTLSRALRPLHPRLVLTDAGPFSGAPESVAVDLVTALAAQMFDFILARPHVSVCEWCGLEYVYQRGRSEYGGHKSTSVKYCSNDCAQASAKKAYRDRKAKERKAARRGGEKHGK